MLYQGTILSGGALVQDIQDSTVRVRKSNNQLIQEVDVRAESVENYNVADSTAVLKDTDGTTISTTPIKATESEDIVAPDVSIEINGVTEGSVVSGGTAAINLVDGGGDPVTPDSVTVVGDTYMVEVPSGGGALSGRELMPTGQTTVFRTGDDADTRLINGRAVDFFTLDYTNPFGNTNRFTDELGGTTYANDIVIDWTTYNAVSGKVLGWYRLRYTTTGGVWDDHIDYYPLLSVGSFTTGWRLPNATELFSILNHSLISRLNYSPFSINNFVWTSTTNANSTSQAYYFVTGGILNAFAKTGTGTIGSIGVRTFTVTGTTLT
jgi:hypothetical protein